MKNLVYVLLVIVVILSAVNLYLITDKGQSITAEMIKAKEDARPANIEVIKLTDLNCRDCFDVNKILSELKSKNVNIVIEETVVSPSEKAKELIGKFGIKKFPTLIVSGEIKKSSIENIWKSEWELKEADGKNYALYTDILPPFADTAKNNEIIGMVSITHILDSSCKECTSLSQVAEFLRKNGVTISEEKTLESNTAEAKVLLDKFSIDKIPAVILSNNILEYPSIKEVWASVNVTEKDGFFAINAQQPPYIDVKSGEIRGLVEAVYLDDKTCKKCYNVSINRQIADRFGLFVVEETLIDVGSPEGEDLIKKYNIEKVPIIMFSPEAKYYEIFANVVWPQAGNITSDGWFVMRNPELLGTYKDLNTGEEINPDKQTQPSGS